MAVSGMSGGTGRARWCVPGGALAFALATSACPEVTTVNNNVNTVNVGAINPAIKPQLESLVRNSEMVPAEFLEIGWRRAQTIALIVTPSRDGRDGRRGTGALVGENLLLTASHVLPDAGAARDAEVQFGYFDGSRPTTTERLSPDEFFETSATGEHDWTLVRVAGNPCKIHGSVPLTKREARVGDRVTIIQHPGGGPMQFASGAIERGSDGKLSYSVSTEQGSSGAPVFDSRWNLMGIHRQGLATVNAGIPIDTILDDLAKRRGPLKATCGGGA
jgi:hypothetical protein